MAVVPTHITTKVLGIDTQHARTTMKNPVAKSLRTPRFAMPVVKSKKLYNRKREKINELFKME